MEKQQSKGIVYVLTNSIQPTTYWEYEGKNLREIYDETYILEE
ncbi:MAG: hypothetical protein ACRDCS_11355 [Tannerellaceae bacterium]